LKYFLYYFFTVYIITISVNSLSHLWRLQSVDPEIELTKQIESAFLIQMTIRLLIAWVKITCSSDWESDGITSTLKVKLAQLAKSTGASMKRKSITMKTNFKYRLPYIIITIYTFISILIYLYLKFYSKKIYMLKETTYQLHF
jgi:hypothetical protein